MDSNWEGAGGGAVMALWLTNLALAVLVVSAAASDGADWFDCASMFGLGLIVGMDVMRSARRRS